MSKTTKQPKTEKVTTPPAQSSQIEEDYIELLSLCRGFVKEIDNVMTTKSITDAQKSSILGEIVKNFSTYAEGLESSQ